MVHKYLGLKHNYGEVDCIELIRKFYSEELNLNFTIPPYPKSRAWMKQFSTTNVDDWASSCAIKVELTSAINYDVMVFKSEKSDLITHFGMFLQPTKMLHVEEGGSSCIVTLSNYWLDKLYTIYRHNDMV